MDTITANRISAARREINNLDNKLNTVLSKVSKTNKKIDSLAEDIKKILIEIEELKKIKN